MSFVEKLGMVDSARDLARRFAERHPSAARRILGQQPVFLNVKETRINVDCATGDRTISDIIDGDAAQKAIAKRTAELVAQEVERIAARRAAEQIASMQSVPQTYLVPVRVIFDAVTAASGYSYDELMGPRRSKNVSAARQIVYWLLKKLRPDLSLPAIGRVVGGRDHTTPLAGIRRFEEKRDQSPIREWLTAPAVAALMTKVEP